MKKLIVAVGMMAATFTAVSAEADAVTLESLQKEIRELKTEIRSLRQEMRMRPEMSARVPRLAGKSDQQKALDGQMRPPADPEARKAWFEARRREHEALRAAQKAKQAEAVKPAQPAKDSNNEQTTKDNNK